MAIKVGPKRLDHVDVEAPSTVSLIRVVWEYREETGGNSVEHLVLTPSDYDEARALAYQVAKLMGQSKVWVRKAGWIQGQWRVTFQVG